VGRVVVYCRESDPGWIVDKRASTAYKDGYIEGFFFDQGFENLAAKVSSGL